MDTAATMPHILVVDDEESIRKVIVAVFAGRNYRISSVANGFAAIKIIESEKVDLVILDLKMPGMDGMELLGRIKDFSSEILVVVITGFADVDNTAKALKAGASDFLPKPFGAQDIFHSVSRLLELQQSRVENQRVLPYFDFSMKAAIPSKSENINGVIHYITEHLKDIGLCAPAQLGNVNIALYEALVNAMLHGNGKDESKKVWLTVDISYNEARFKIRDEGSGFVPDETGGPSDTKNLYKASGRGIYLMRHFMDSVSYNEIGNEVTMVKKRTPAAGDAPA